MRRIVPMTLLALATFVAPPAKPRPTPLPTLASIAPGKGGEMPDMSDEPARPNGDEEIGHAGQPGDQLPLVVASLAFSIPDDDGHQAAPRGGLEPSPHAAQQADIGPPDASTQQATLREIGNGATPREPMAAAPDSATPISAGALTSMTPVAIAAIRGNGLQSPHIYIGLIKPENMESEQRCLAEAIYFEARSESEDGRAAIAQVVLNRVRSGTYPTSVCGVVYQNRHRKLACQFSFACEGKSLRITEPEPWEAAVRIARDVYAGKIYVAEVGASTHYHAAYVRPQWAKKLRKMDVIGRHIFYS